MDMKTHPFTTMATALAFLTLAACADLTGDVTDPNGSGTSDGMMLDELTTVQDLLVYLETEGHTVVAGPSMHEPIFGVTGTQLNIDGRGDIQVFQFASEDAAENATSDISDDGSTVGTSQVEWVSEPHFFQDGNLVVLYVGTDDIMLNTLEGALGAQIAGSDPDDDLFPDDDDALNETGALMDGE